MRGLSHHLNQPQGRIYQYGCDATLGDARCRVDLSSPLYRAEGEVVSAESAQRFAATGLGTFGEEWFARGRLAWTSGENSGRAMEVRSQRSDGAHIIIELWQPMALPIAPADTFTVAAGCDKQLATCKTKFANVVNFRGFPHMPGPDYILAVAKPGAPVVTGRSGVLG